ncbi:hypothetical protein GOP47_0016205 [Adiantum capillus-veneris]|uniref:DNA topoisomerase (ATP-hydrolyzing) n=1 Tax=Adiantum capillus-veneris TaxID=13818 RepID=A0A9D4UHE1_ADICA|nr:hypothetical protein GOP47_0016205 [Adiantum capillus-veneris]
MAMASREETPFHTLEYACTAESVPSEEVHARIQSLMLLFLKNLTAVRPSILDLSLLCRSAENCHAKTSFFGADEPLFLSHSTYNRPFVKKQFTKAFVRVWMVLRISYQLLEEGKQATQRELFYRLLSESPGFFKCQQQVNDTIQDVVAVLKCSRNSLGILASSKGSVTGRLLIQEPNGSLLDCTKIGSAGQVISGDLKCVQNWRFQSDARYILLVEKDAIFQRLQEDRFFHSVPCIIITARGYPDLASRVFLHQLRCSFPLLPIVALVDWNPAGLAIICTYKFGSIRMGLEALSYVCDVKWLGLRSRDLELIPKESHLPLTAKDRRLGASLLSSKMLQNKEQYKQELAYMLEFGQRIEIEALYAHGYSFLGKYVSQKIVQRDYI